MSAQSARQFPPNQRVGSTNVARPLPYTVQQVYMRRRLLTEQVDQLELSMGTIKGENSTLQVQIDALSQELLSLKRLVSTNNLQISSSASQVSQCYAEINSLDYRAVPMELDNQVGPPFSVFPPALRPDGSYQEDGRLTDCATTFFPSQWKGPKARVPPHLSKPVKRISTAYPPGEREGQTCCAIVVAPAC